MRATMARVSLVAATTTEFVCLLALMLTLLDTSTWATPVLV